MSASDRAERLAWESAVAKGDESLIGESLPDFLGRVSSRAQARPEVLQVGHSVVELPGYTVRWGNLSPVLDRLAAAGMDRITVDGLRSAVNKSS
jgi:hypothetical protein